MKRNVGLDLAKIICMIMIICTHLIGREELQSGYNLSDTNYYIIKLLSSFCCVAVNCYFIITGYYTINKRVKFSKILRIWETVIFYTLSFLIIFLIVDIKSVTTTNVIKSIFPIITENYWFVTTYIGICLLTPIMSIILPKLSKKQYKYFMLVVFILFSLIETVYPLTGVFSAGRGINFQTSFLMYIIGGYIKLHIHEEKINRTKSLLMYVIFAILIFIKAIVLDAISTINNNLLNYYVRCYAYNSVFTVISSAMFFMYFLKLDIKCKWISKIQSLSFATYLIHEDIFIRLKTVGAIVYQNSWKFIPYIIICSLGIFIVSCLIELIRQNIFNKLKIEKKLEEKLDLLEERIFEN